MQSIFPNAWKMLARYPRLILFVAFALCFLPVYAPMLTGFLLYIPGDTLGFNYPPLKALQPFSMSSLLADPFSGRGFPWIVTYGTLDPIAHVLRLFLNEYLTFAWLCYLYHVFGGWLFSLFLYRRSHSTGASFIGGLVYAGAFFWVSNADYPLAFTVPLFAGLLYASSFLHSHPFRAFLAMSFGIAYGWLAGHFNFVPLSVVMLAVVTGWMAVRSNEHSLLLRVRPFLLFCGATAMGSIIGLIKIVPALAYVEHSERAGGLAVESAGRAALELSSFYTAFFPYLTIPFLPGEIGQLFFGATGLALLLVAVLQRDRGMRPILWALFLIVLIALPHSPLYAAIQSLPFFSFLRAPRRWLILAYVCIGFLTGGMADRLQNGNTRYVRGVGQAFWVIGILVTCTSIAVVAIDVWAGESIVRSAQDYFDAHLYATTSGLPLEHYHRHIEQLWQNTVTNVSVFSMPFLFPLIGLLLTGWVFRLRTTYHRSMLVLTGLTVISIIPAFFFHQPKASFGDLRAAQEQWAKSAVNDRYILPLLSGQADQIVRTGVVGDVPAERLRYQIGLLTPNAQALADIRSIDFYQPLQPTRMGRLLAALGSTSAVAPQDERLILAAQPIEEKIDTVMRRLPLMQRMGVQLISSSWDLPAPLALAESLSFVDGLPDIKLYQLPATRPIAYVPSLIRVQNTDEDAAIAYLRDAESVDPSLIECENCIYSERTQTGALVNIIERTDTTIAVAVDTAVSSYLNILQPRLPGWRAYVDGVVVRTAIGDGMFFAVPVPAGKHEVHLEITYRTLFIDSVRLLLTGEDPWLL